MIRFCAASARAWMIRVGNSRRSLDLARADRRHRSPRAIGPARMLAAATASWMARLMPTPPIGDMAWAASPIASRPGRCQRVSRSSATVSSWSSSQLVELAATGRARERRCRDLARGTRRGPRALIASAIALGEDDRRIANSRRGRSARRMRPASTEPRSASPASPRLGQAEPEHVHRRAEILERQQPSARGRASARPSAAMTSSRAQLAAVGEPHAGDRGRPPR